MLTLAKTGMEKSAPKSAVVWIWPRLNWPAS